MAVVSGGSGFVVQAVPGAPIPDNADGGDDGGAKGSVWVVNRDLGELAIFDAETGELIEKLKVGAGAHDICISEKAGKAYITAEAINAVTAVDIETLATESIPVGPLPHHIEPSHDGRKIFVTLASHPMTVPAPGTPAFATIDTDDNSVTYTTTSSHASVSSAASSNPSSTCNSPSTASWPRPTPIPKPFVWTADPKRVLAAVKRGKQVLESIH